MQSPISQVEVTDFDRALLNRAYKTGVALGRKFEALDMTSELRNAAKLYASIYRPTDEGFMADMYLRAISGFLSDGQSKGVLNVMMADARRRLAAKRPAVAAAESATVAVAAHVMLANVPDGRFRVTLPDGDHLAIHIKAAGKDSKLNGSRIVSTRINGDEWMGVAHIPASGELRLWRSCAGSLRDRITASVTTLDAAKTEDEWLVAGLAFAQEGSQCFFCGRDLDTPESLLVGYGPHCADKNGLPWGAKAIPMSVRLAQAGALAPAPAPAAPAVEPVFVGSPSDDAADDAAWEDYVAATKKQKEERIQTAAEFADWTQTMIARAQAEGRSRTYEEIFGEDSD